MNDFRTLTDEELISRILRLHRLKAWGWEIAALEAERDRRAAIRLHAAIGTPAGSRYYE